MAPCGAGDDFDAGRRAKKGSPFVEKARLAVLGLARWQLAGLVGSLTVLSCGLTTVLVDAAPSAVLTRAPRLCTRARKALRDHLESVSMP